jgi:hypothetical protein
MNNGSKEEDRHHPSTPAAPNRPGLTMLVTTDPSNKDDPRAKQAKSRTQGGRTASGDSKKKAGKPKEKIIVEGKLYSNPMRKISKKHASGGGGDGGGDSGGNSGGVTRGRSRNGCMSLEELFHLVFLFISLGFLLVYLREVTIPFVIAVFLMYLFRPLADNVESCFRGCGSEDSEEATADEREDLLNYYRDDLEEGAEEGDNKSPTKNGYCCSKTCAGYTGRIVGTALSVILSLCFMSCVAVIIAHVSWSLYVVVASPLALFFYF